MASEHYTSMLLLAGVGFLAVSMLPSCLVATVKENELLSFVASQQHCRARGGRRVFKQSLFLFVYFEYTTLAPGSYWAGDA